MTTDNALMRLQDLCARSEHSEGELREKLWRWGIGQADSDRILQKLRSGKFVDDRRFAYAFCRQKLIFNRWGRKKIALALMAKRVDRNIAAEALDALDETEYSGVLLSAMRAKARQIKEGNTYEGRTKLYRAMISRGFESPLVSAEIKNPDSRLWDF